MKVSPCRPSRTLPQLASTISQRVSYADALVFSLFLISGFKVPRPRRCQNPLFGRCGRQPGVLMVPSRATVRGLDLNELRRQFGRWPVGTWFEINDRFLGWKGKD